MTFIWEQFHWRHLSHQSLKLIWQLHIKNFIKSLWGQWVNLSHVPIKSVYVFPFCIVPAYWDGTGKFRWLSARLQYLHYLCSGDTTVSQWAIDLVLHHWSQGSAHLTKSISFNHSCWWLVDAKGQSINSCDIDLVWLEYTNPCMARV